MPVEGWLQATGLGDPLPLLRAQEECLGDLRGIPGALV